MVNLSKEEKTIGRINIKKLHEFHWYSKLSQALINSIAPSTNVITTELLGFITFLLKYLLLWNVFIIAITTQRPVLLKKNRYSLLRMLFLMTKMNTLKIVKIYNTLIGENRYIIIGNFAFVYIKKERARLWYVQH